MAAIATFLTLSESYQSKCDDQADSEVCAQLLKDFKGALLQDEGNSFRIRRLFFLIVLIILYTLLIGNGAAVSTSPLFIITISIDLYIHCCLKG